MSGMCLRYISVADAALDVNHLAPQSVSAALSRSRCSLTSLSSAVSAALALLQQPLLSSLRQILSLCLVMNVVISIVDYTSPSCTCSVP